MAAKQSATDALLDMLKRFPETPSVTVRSRSSHHVFYVPHLLLSNVSQELAEFCLRSSYAPVFQEPLQIFLIWLFGLSFESKSQKIPAQAWIFGARFKIAAFQNAVMRQLTDMLRKSSAELAAVGEVYEHSEPLAHCELVRKAFIAHICYDIASLDVPYGGFWSKVELKQHELGTNARFMRDITRAMCTGDVHIDDEIGGPEVSELLVAE